MTVSKRFLLTPRDIYIILFIARMFNRFRINGDQVYSFRFLSHIGCLNYICVAQNTFNSILDMQLIMLNLLWKHNISYQDMVQVARVNILLLSSICLFFSLQVYRMEFFYSNTRHKICSFKVPCTSMNKVNSKYYVIYFIPVCRRRHSGAVRPSYKIKFVFGTRVHSFFLLAHYYAEYVAFGLTGKLSSYLSDPGSKLVNGTYRAIICFVKYYYGYFPYPLLQHNAKYLQW